MSVTTRLRVVFSSLLVGVVLAAVVGWFLGKDPSQLGPVMAWIAAAVAAGEAANVGKRATFKKEACDVED